jgi:3-oxoacyl-(acyl-carrier-protein) synthase
VVEAVATVLQLEAATAHGNPRLRTPVRDDVDLPVEPVTLREPLWAIANGFGFGGFRSTLVFGHASTVGRSGA